MTHIRTKNWSV